MQNIATIEDKEKGFDIADLLTRMDWKEFREPEQPEQIEETKLNKTEHLKKAFIFPEQVVSMEKESHKSEQYKEPILKREDWTPELIEFENYFKMVSFPAMVQLNKAAKITNVPLFIDTHFQTLNNYNGNKTFLPYLNRLRNLKQLLTTN